MHAGEMVSRPYLRGGPPGASERSTPRCLSSEGAAPPSGCSLTAQVRGQSSHLLFFLIPDPCDVLPLHLDLGVIRDLQRDRFLAEIRDRPPDSAGRNDLVALLQRVQHFL